MKSNALKYMERPMQEIFKLKTFRTPDLTQYRIAFECIIQAILNLIFIVGLGLLYINQKQD